MFFPVIQHRYRASNEIRNVLALHSISPEAQLTLPKFTLKKIGKINMQHKIIWRRFPRLGKTNKLSNEENRNIGPSSDWKQLIGGCFVAKKIELTTLPGPQEGGFSRAGGTSNDIKSRAHFTRKRDKSSQSATAL